MLRLRPQSTRTAATRHVLLLNKKLSLVSSKKGRDGESFAARSPCFGTTSSGRHSLLHTGTPADPHPSPRQVATPSRLDLLGGRASSWARRGLECSRPASWATGQSSEQSKTIHRTHAYIRTGGKSAYKRKRNRSTAGRRRPL